LRCKIRNESEHLGISWLTLVDENYPIYSRNGLVELHAAVPRLSDHEPVAQHPEERH
jgi:hypothetical protein